LARFSLMVFLLSKTVLILLVTTRLRVTERESISTYSIYNQNPLKMEQPYYLPPAEEVVRQVDL
jgi:hypothetical protein